MAAVSANQKKNSELWVQKVHALTGSIGSGKSSVAKILKQQGAFVISADDLAREVVEIGTPGLARVIAEFGQEFLNPDGSLNRRELGRVVFQDETKRLKLESIVIPLIQAQAQKIFESNTAIEKVKIYEVPLLFEKGMERRGFRSIILVSATPQNCIERAVKRDNISKAEVAARLAAQIPIEQKRQAATYIIENNGSYEELEAQATALFSKLSK